MYGIRPLLGPGDCCKFSVTCTKFAEVQMEEHHLHTALINITKRVWSCGPF